jgi:hypothetical protein
MQTSSSSLMLLCPSIMLSRTSNVSQNCTEISHRVQSNPMSSGGAFLYVT